MKDFANYLKEIRHDSGLTQTQFAARIEIDSAALSKIENDKKEFDVNKLENLSIAFNLNLNDIKKRFFGEKFAIELFGNKCPIDALEIAEKKYKYLKGNK